MKRLFILLLFFPLYAISQKTNVDEKSEVPSPFEFRLVDSLSLSRSDIYTRLRTFVAIAFNSAKNVIQMDDKESGKIICKGIMNPILKYRLMGDTVKFKGNVKFTLQIDVKENKYRCIMNNFILESNDVEDIRPYGSLIMKCLTDLLLEKRIGCQ